MLVTAVAAVSGGAAAVTVSAARPFDAARIDRLRSPGVAAPTRAASQVLVALPLGRSAAVGVGDPIAAIGRPFGSEGSLSVGVVSAPRSRAMPRSTTATRATRGSTARCATRPPRAP